MTTTSCGQQTSDCDSRPVARYTRRSWHWWHRTDALILAVILCLGARLAGAQAESRWQFGAGPSVAAAPPRRAFGVSGGGLVRGTFFPTVRSNGVSWGLDIRAAYLGWRLSGGQICTLTCSEIIHPYVIAVAGAGLAGQVSRTIRGTASAHLRAFAEPAVVVAAIHKESGTAGGVSPSGGLAVGISRRRLRLDFEGQALPNTQGKVPILWSLQLVVVR